MSVRRALVDCVVLSLQDTCVLYPCCKDCFSRIDVEQQDKTRCRCFRCGYSCVRDMVGYRYRLSLRVAHDRCIFGVTVFGNCLSPFFGIHATDLQRLVENLDGPVSASTRSMLLLKAVKDCFIGRRFIFGIKLTGSESPWSSGPSANGSGTRDGAHVIASQMILPKASGLEGCTVVSYFQTLVQKATERELGSADSSKTPSPLATSLQLIADRSHACSFNDDAHCSSGFLPHSLLSLQCQDSTFTATPPWQQSLGLVTSSAEQEEGCSTQDSGDEDSRQADQLSTPHLLYRGCKENLKATEETVQMQFLEKPTRNTLILNSWSSLSPRRGTTNEKWFSPEQQTESSLQSSVAGEDLPFSESLTEFLCEQNKDFDIVTETELRRNVQHLTEAPENNPEIRSQHKNTSVQSLCVSQSKTADSFSQMLLDVTSAPALHGGDGHDFSYQERKNPVGSINKSQAKNSSSYECNPEDRKAALLESVEEEMLEGDAYNCSADLFGDSLSGDTTTNPLNKQTQSVGTDCAMLSKPENWHLGSEKTTDRQLNSKKYIKRDSLIPPGTQDLEFIPPSQSTPIIKVKSGSSPSSNRSLTLSECRSHPDYPDSSAFHRNLSECASYRAAKVPLFLCNLNCVSSNQVCQCAREATKENLTWNTTSSRHSDRFTPKRRFLKVERNRKHLLTQQHLRLQIRAQSTKATGNINHRYSTSHCNMSGPDPEDSKDAIVHPTPAAKTQKTVKHRIRKQTDHSGSSYGNTSEGQQGDGANCERTELDQRLESSQRGLAKSGHVDRMNVFEGTQRDFEGSCSYFLNDEDEACDWSKDLFSDSV